MKKHQGITLLEIILVIVVISIILMLTLRYFVFTNNDFNVTRAVTQIQALDQASDQWLEAQRQTDFAGPSSETVVSIEKLKEAGLIAASDTKNPWGGEITVSPSSDDPTYVTITVEDIPKQACFNLIERMKPVAHRQILKQGCINLKKYFVEL